MSGALRTQERVLSFAKKSKKIRKILAGEKPLRPGSCVVLTTLAFAH